MFDILGFRLRVLGLEADADIGLGAGSLAVRGLFFYNCHFLAKFVYFC